MALITVFAFRQEAQTNNSNQNNQQNQDEEATVIEKGKLTARDREYGIEFKKLYSDLNIPFSQQIELSERIGKGKEVIGGHYAEIEIIGNPLSKHSPLEYLSSIACKSDLIVIGVVKDKAASMSEDETIIFTKHLFLVSGIIKNNSLNPISNNSNIEFARPGGVIIFKNRRIRHENLTYEKLQKNKSYILFLKYLPNINGYIAASPKGDFAIENNSFEKLSKYKLPQDLEKKKNDLSLLLNDLRRSVQVNCSQIPEDDN